MFLDHPEDLSRSFVQNGVTLGSTPIPYLMLTMALALLFRGLSPQRGCPSLPGPGDVLPIQQGLASSGLPGLCARTPGEDHTTRRGRETNLLRGSCPSPTMDQGMTPALFYFPHDRLWGWQARSRYPSVCSD